MLITFIELKFGEKTVLSILSENKIRKSKETMDESWIP